jgi:hypothetical protein
MNIKKGELGKRLKMNTRRKIITHLQENPN